MRAARPNVCARRGAATAGGAAWHRLDSCRRYLRTAGLTRRRGHEEVKNGSLSTPNGTIGSASPTHKGDYREIGVWTVYGF